MRTDAGTNDGEREQMMDGTVRRQNGWPRLTSLKRGSRDEGDRGGEEEEESDIRRFTSNAEEEVKGKKKGSKRSGKRKQ